MLNTKYQESRLSGLRQEDFKVFILKIYFSLYDLDTDWNHLNNLGRWPPRHHCVKLFQKWARGLGTSCRLIQLLTDGQRPITKAHLVTLVT